MVTERRGTASPPEYVAFSLQVAETPVSFVVDDAAVLLLRTG